MIFEMLLKNLAQKKFKSTTVESKSKQFYKHEYIPGEPLIKSPFWIGGKNDFSKFLHKHILFELWMPSTMTVYGSQKVWVRFNLLSKITSIHFESANNLFFKQNSQSNP